MIERRRSSLVLAALAAAALAAPALADDQPPTPSAPPPTPAPPAAPSAPAKASAGSTASEVVVTAQRLDAARDTIQPMTGASTYAFSQQAIETLPAGDNTAINQVLLQAPGVAQDSFGQLHIRGEHNGLQYRLNGIILPEGLSVFSQALSPRLADNVELITGALPAEFGLRTAGIIDISTKSGELDNGGSVGLYGGSQDEIEPSFDLSGSRGNVNYFVSGSYLQDNLGIESPDGRANPLHDNTEQYQGFAYMEDILDPESRITVILGTSDDRFQIPDLMGGEPSLGLDVNGLARYPSQDLSENQAEDSQYGVVSYLHSTDRLTVEVSLYGRYSTLKFTPDEVGDILYNGVSQIAAKGDLAGGLQAEAAYSLNDQHTVRGGLIIAVDHATSDTTSQVLLVNNDAASPYYGQQISSAPYTIVENSAATAETYSAYLQDEWKPLGNLTINYGARFDQFNGFLDQNQISPRVNVVWLPAPSVTLHVGYARYFTPPPFELIASESVQKFIEPIPGNPDITSTNNPVVAACGILVLTTACPLVSRDSTPSAERANYFDAGAARKVGRFMTLTVDSYLKLSRDLIDEGQFGAPIILTPFNYAKGAQWGIEWTASYAQGPASAYINAAFSKAEGEDWISSQFDFPQSQIDYTADHYLYLDHDERVDASAGASYLWQGTRIGGDLIFGTGLRQNQTIAPAAEPDGSVLNAIPNGLPVQEYVQVNLAVTHKFADVWGAPLEVRFDVTNAFDELYQIRTGAGVGVFAPQYGPRRGLFFGVTKYF